MSPRKSSGQCVIPGPLEQNKPWLPRVAWLGSGKLAFKCPRHASLPFEAVSDPRISLAACWGRLLRLRRWRRSRYPGFDGGDGTYR